MHLDWIGPTLGGVLCSGCLFGFEPEPDEEDPIPLVSIATGAELTLRLEDGGLCSQSIGAQCLSSRPDTILDVAIGNEDIVELGMRQLDSTTDTLRVDLRAVREGKTSMEVTYLDRRGDEVTDRIDLRVADLERVELDVLCPVFGHTGDVYPVTTGAEVPFRHAAFDVDGNELATGRMEVVRDFGGFTVPGPPVEDGEIRRATAPADGTHDWPLVGDGSVTPTFPVFGAGQFDLVLTETSSHAYSSGVHLGRVVGGAPLCVHDGEARAEVEVTAGGCLPLVSGVEIVDPVPVNVAQNDVELGLSGAGACEVRATLVGGPSTAITIDVDNPAPVPEPGTGTELGPAPIEHGKELEQHGGCTTTKNLSNGNCEIIDAVGIILPDADCLFDIKWIKILYDGTDPEPLPGGSLMGVGLRSELRVNIEYELIGFVPFGTYAPNNLSVRSMPAGVAAASLGCDDEDAQVLALVPEAAGDYQLELSADNAFDGSTYELRTRTVTAFDVDFGADDRLVSPDGSEVWFFVGNRVEALVRYQDADGNQVFGTAPLVVSSDDGSAGATISEPYVDTGVASNVISVASPHAPQVHRLGVVDPSAIVGVRGLAEQQLSVGSVQCFTGYPVGPNDLRIHGISPVRPQLRRTGDDAVVFEIDPFADNDGEICLRGATQGTVDLELGWGVAATQAPWTVL